MANLVRTETVLRRENEILNIIKRLAKEKDKCIIIVTHSQNVCNKVDIVYELKKDKK